MEISFGVLILIIIAILIFISVAILSIGNDGNGYDNKPHEYIDFEQREIKRAGDAGEKFANSRINELLNENDIHLNNIVIESNDKRIEIDNLIINENGIFIVEVKNYVGRLYGDVEDKYWTKYKIAVSGETYSKKVKNPIKQAKTQLYFLKEFLKENGIYIRIEPYAFLINGGSPVQDEHIIDDLNELEEIIHTKREKPYRKDLIDKTVNLLTK